MLNLDYSFLNWAVVQSFVAKGFWFSVQLTVVAMVGGILLGTLLAMMRLSSHKWLSVPAALYVDTLRSIPLVMVILWFFLLIPKLLGPLGGQMSAFITFTLFHAGYALGMTYGQSMRLVVLPQAFRNMLPVLLTQTIILFQDTSLVYAVGEYDLLKGFEVAGKNFNRPVETYLVAAVVYFVICFGLSRLVRELQKKIAIIR